MPIFGLFNRKRAAKSSSKGRQQRQDGRWSKVDKSWLTTGLSLAHANEVLHGATAEFYPDGQLRRLSHYSEGKPSLFHHCLELELGIPSARVVGEGVLCVFYYGLEEIHVLFEDEAEFTSGSAVWDDWVRKWIAQICAGGRVNIRPEE
ncbi:hypothetical protein IV102_01220 [bacterium]|nr:hypothetical protein [bacterium]